MILWPVRNLKSSRTAADKGYETPWFFNLEYKSRPQNLLPNWHRKHTIPIYTFFIVQNISRFEYEAKKDVGQIFNNDLHRPQIGSRWWPTVEYLSGKHDVISATLRWLSERRGGVEHRHDILKILKTFHMDKEGAHAYFSFLTLYIYISSIGGAHFSFSILFPLYKLQLMTFLRRRTIQWREAVSDRADSEFIYIYI